MRSGQVAGIIGFALVAVATVGCGPRMQERRAQKVEETAFRWGLRSTIGTLDPALIQLDQDRDVLRQVYETLVTYDEQLRIRPLLAESWTLSPDRLTYTFRIKPNVAFSDGTPCTGESIAQSIARVRDPQTNSAFAREILQSVQSVRAADASTLVIRLSRPVRTLLHRLAYPALGIARPKAGEITRFQDAIGTGPYVITAYEADRRLEMRANAGYHGPPPATAKLVFEIIPDSSLRFAKFQSGDLDLTTITSGDVVQARSDLALTAALRFTAKPTVNYLQLNPRAEPDLQSAALRKQLFNALDPVLLILGPMKNSGYLPADRILPPGLSTQTMTYPRRETGARPNGKYAPLVMYAELGRQNPIVDWVVTQWRERLALEAAGAAMQDRTLRDKNQRDQVGIYFTGYSADWPDPDCVLTPLFHSKSSANRSRFANARVDRLLEQGDAAASAEQAQTFYSKAEKIILEEAPIIPLYFQTEPELVSPRVKGLRFTPFGHLSLASVTCREGEPVGSR